MSLEGVEKEYAKVVVSYLALIVDEIVSFHEHFEFCGKPDAEAINARFYKASATYALGLQ